MIVDNRGKISQRKREQLNSDLEIQSSYILVGVMLGTFLETPIQPTFLSEEPLWSYSRHILSTFSIPRIHFPQLIHILIIKTDQDTLQNISFSTSLFLYFDSIGTDLIHNISIFLMC